VEVVGEAANRPEAVELCHRLGPDVVLMDVRMPVMDGIEATRRLAEAAPSPRTLILTTFDQDENVHRALEAGACGFLLKDAGRERLIDAIETVARGEAGLRDRVQAVVPAYETGLVRPGSTE
jgi:DNA-binding NarL/FixJ family response regulator